MKGKVIVITGPTASGKSALAVEVARRLGTEVISADSRQIYRGIPIVTAVPTAEERRGVKHHLMEILELSDYYSASEFEQDALCISRQLIEERGAAVVCGGSMMYIDAFCYGIDELPTVPAEIRNALTEEMNERGTEWLLTELEHWDPEYFAIVDRNNIKRVFHAVEIIRTTGATYTSMRKGAQAQREFDIEKYELTAERSVLFERINSRVDAMIEMGLEQEAERVYALRHLNSLNTVGLKEMFTMFEGGLGREEAIERIKKNTRVYAKKQIAWRKRFADFERLNIEVGLDALAAMVKK